MSRTFLKGTETSHFSRLWWVFKEEAEFIFTGTDWTTALEYKWIGC